MGHGITVDSHLVWPSRQVQPQPAFKRCGCISKQAEQPHTGAAAAAAGGSATEVFAACLQCSLAHMVLLQVCLQVPSLTQLQHCGKRGVVNLHGVHKQQFLNTDRQPLYTLHQVLIGC